MGGNIWKFVRFDRLGRHARVIFRKPENGPPVINLRAIDELREVVTIASQDPLIRSLSIHSDGEGVFLAGGDLEEFQALDKEAGRSMAEAMREVLWRLENLPYPVIAVIEGDAFGGGCELVLAADMRLAAPQARLAFTQGRFGLIPGWGGATRLTRVVGRARALALLMTGQPITARQAKAIGLVDEVVPKEKIGDRLAEIQANLEMVAPEAIRAVKEVVSAAVRLPYEESLRLELDLFVGLWGSQAHKEGLRAFFEKRAPAWAADDGSKRARGDTGRLRKAKA